MYPLFGRVTAGIVWHFAGQALANDIALRKKVEHASHAQREGSQRPGNQQSAVIVMSAGTLSGWLCRVKPPLNFG